jgi:glutamyl-tRNA synthetase
LIYQYFGWAAPQFAHLPLLLKPEGNGKLSKRDADLGGFPIFPLLWQDPVSGVVARGFREDGYLKEATVNFLAFLGWNPGTEQELFTMDELIEAFSIERIHKAGARFDITKAKWFNQQYLKQLSDEALVELVYSLRSTVYGSGFDIEKGRLAKICHLMKDRVTFPQEILSETTFLFEAPAVYEEAIVAGKWNADAVKAITTYIEDLKVYEGEFLADTAKAIWAAAAERAGIKMGKVMQALRLAVTGAGHGPDLMLAMEILGKDEVVSRLEKALERLSQG